MLFTDILRDISDLFDNNFQGCLASNYRDVYTDRITDYNNIQDAVLFTSINNRYPSIGNDSIRIPVFKYFFDNIFWINICLFVNKDFRNCFQDAILIEKAMLQLEREDYDEFRKDMKLAPYDAEREPGNYITYNIDQYDLGISSGITNTITASREDFNRQGMMTAYNELITRVAGNKVDQKAVAYIIDNIVYVVNSLNNNDVFYKYVNLVVDNVKKQLSQLPVSTSK